MAYDNTKLDLAVSQWITDNCELTFGETYSAELQTDFEQYCADNSLMKRSPGRVAFGSALGRRDFEKRKVCGLTMYAGLTLKTPANTFRPRENAKSPDTMRLQSQQARQEEAEKKRKDMETEKKLREKEQKNHAAEVKKRMAGETKESVQAAGGELDSELDSEPAGGELPTQKTDKKPTGKKSPGKKKAGKKKPARKKTVKPADPADPD